METIIKKYPTIVEVTFENQSAYDADQAAGIILHVPVGEKGLYGTYVFQEGINRFVHQLRYLEAVKVSDHRPETIDSLKKEFCEKRTANADL